MRLTCLKCGHQIELATGPHSSRIPCVCGQDYSYPEVLDTGVQPSRAAAERSRSRAFRAAGLVKNMGGFALGISMLAVLFFPLGIVGAAIAVYVLTMLRGPVGRYSGRRQALVALVFGVGVFLVEGSVALSWFKAKRLEALLSKQSRADDDLRALLRTQRLYRADNDTYGTFKEFGYRFKARHGDYTLYLGPDDSIEAQRQGEKFTDPLPPEVAAGVSESAFTAAAVGNIDGDPFLDVWVINDSGTLTHLQNDIDDSVLTGAAAPAAGGSNVAVPDAPAVRTHNEPVKLPEPGEPSASDAPAPPGTP